MRWLLMWAGMVAGTPGDCQERDAPVLGGDHGPAAAPPPSTRTRAARDWELAWCSLARTGRAFGRWAGRKGSCGPGHGSGRAAGAGLAGFCPGPVMHTAAPSEKEVCMKSGFRSA